MPRPRGTRSVLSSNVRINCINGLIAEVVVLDEFTAVYKPAGDLVFYVIGSSSENELLLLTALNVFRDTMDTLLRHAHRAQLHSARRVFVEAHACSEKHCRP